jgi:hypothetical protein
MVASQFISNVPLVALYLPVLEKTLMSTKGLITLAAGSTIACNLYILGAASNVDYYSKCGKEGTSSNQLLGIYKEWIAAHGCKHTGLLGIPEVADYIADATGRILRTAGAGRVTDFV